MYIDESDIQRYEDYKISVSQTQIFTDEKISNEMKRLGIYHRYLLVQSAITIAEVVAIFTHKNELISNKLLAHWIFTQPKGMNHLKVINKKKKTIGEKWWKSR